jgi:hypothetical protein
MSGGLVAALVMLAQFILYAVCTMSFTLTGGVPCSIPHGHPPFNPGCLPLSYSGGPGFNGVSHRGVNGKHPAQVHSTRWLCCRTALFVSVSQRFPVDTPSMPAVYP